MRNKPKQPNALRRAIGQCSGSVAQKACIRLPSPSRDPGSLLCVTRISLPPWGNRTDSYGVCACQVRGPTCQQRGQSRAQTATPTRYTITGWARRPQMTMMHRSGETAIPRRPCPPPSKVAARVRPAKGDACSDRSAFTSATTAGLNAESPETGQLRALHHRLPARLRS